MKAGGHRHDKNLCIRENRLCQSIMSLSPAIRVTTAARIHHLYDNKSIIHAAAFRWIFGDTKCHWLAGALIVIFASVRRIYVAYAAKP